VGLPAQRGTVPTDGKGAQLTVNRLELILILLTEMVYRASSHRVRQAEPVHAGQISTVLVAIFLARATAEGRVANDRAAARYRAALLETRPDKLSERIQEASMAIKVRERELQTKTVNAADWQVLEDARNTLNVLRRNDR